MYREFRGDCGPSQVGSNITPTMANTSQTIHQAAKNGDVAVLKAMVNETTLKERDSEGATALYRAAETGQLEAVQLLIKAGANLNARKRKRWRPLHIAAKMGYYDIVNALVQAGCDINQVTNRNMTPLMLSCKHGHLEVTKNLLRHGADINIGDMFDRSALTWAVKSGSMEIFHALEDAGANLRVEDSFKKNLLIQSVKSDRPDILKYLLENGLDHTKEDKHYRAPIHMAAAKGRSKCLQILLDHGIGIDIPASNGRWPLDYAATMCHYEVTKLLLSRGANPRKTDSKGLTPLHKLALSSRIPTHRGKKDKPYYDTAFLLIDANSDLDGKAIISRTPQSPLDIAVNYSRCFPLIKLLARAGSSASGVHEHFHKEPNLLPPTLRKTPEILDWLKDIYENPRKLKEQCRMVVRRTLGVNFREMSQMQIPTGLCNYLHFSDFKALHEKYSVLASGEPDQTEGDNDSETEYNPSAFNSEYGDDPNIVDTDSDS